MTGKAAKLIAQALVEQGYSAPFKDMSYTDNDGTFHECYQLYTPDPQYPHEIVRARTLAPFDDTLEGRRQADALVDYLQINHDMLWVHNWLSLPVNPEAMPMRGRLLKTIELCFEQLAGESE